MGIGVQQQIAVMRAVGQIVDDHQITRGRPHRALPVGRQGVMVDDQPVGPDAGQLQARLLGILLPGAAEPVGIGRGLGVWGWPGNGTPCGQSHGFMPPGLHQAALRAPITREEMAHGALACQRVGQRQATHQVARADPGRRLDAECHLQNGGVTHA